MALNLAPIDRRAGLDQERIADLQNPFADYAFLGRQWQSLEEESD